MVRHLLMGGLSIDSLRALESEFARCGSSNMTNREQGHWTT
jgi:hypothetical protein